MFGLFKRINSPKKAYKYALRTNKQTPELEFEIAKSAKYSFYYAENVIQGRFKLGEPAIAKDAEYSYLYAQDILKGRFELGEETFAQDAEYSYMYAFNVLKGRFELGEPAIAKNARYSYLYALNILKGRFELGEKAIDESDCYSYFYDKDVLKGRFELGESDTENKYKIKGNNKIISAKEIRKLNNDTSDDFNFLLKELEEKILATKNPLDGAKIEIDQRIFNHKNLDTFVQLLLDSGYYVRVTCFEKKYCIHVQWIEVQGECNVCGFMFLTKENIVNCLYCVEGEAFYEE